MGRSLAAADAEAGYYHCISRVVERRWALGEMEKERFVKFMRAYEEFCGVQIVTFCILSNHFHILVKVPRRPAVENLPSDEELVRLVEIADCTYSSVELAGNLQSLRENGDDAGAEELRERFFCRMWSVSAFLQTLKQRFTQWFNGVYDRTGTLWEGRFKSVLVEGLEKALATISAYIDLNSVRAGIVTDPAAYRWCGYAEAMAGRKRALAGLSIAVQARLEQKLPSKKILAAYRKYLYEKGVARSACVDGTRARRGFSKEQVEAVIKAGGKLGAFDALRCRVRYFCDGVVFGSKGFVEDFFTANRSKFGVNREDGARAMRNINLPDLYTARDLRTRVVTPSNA